MLYYMTMVRHYDDLLLKAPLNLVHLLQEQLALVFLLGALAALLCSIPHPVTGLQRDVLLLLMQFVNRYF
jgi:hypothetical protein